MKVLEIRGCRFGEGMPKVCIPIMGKTLDELKTEINQLDGFPYDVIEWRVDHFNDVDNLEAVSTAAKLIRELLGNTVLLSTFRTHREGGEKEISIEEYIQLNKAIIDTQCTDLLDVECFTGDNEVKEIVAYAHNKGVKIVMSNHDFNKTPSYDEIVRRLHVMDALGADIPKIALMPVTKKDCLTVLCATDTVSETIDKPIITMSMSRRGVVSRMVGEVFGSCLTFGTAGKASAPGQMNAKDLKDVLEIVHRSI